MTPSDDFSPTDHLAADRLNGWKEIASHLGRSLRTVQRWEAVFGMPVYRIGTRGEHVHAYRHELDAWLRSVGWTRDVVDNGGNGDDAADAPEASQAGAADLAARAGVLDARPGEVQAGGGGAAVLEAPAGVPAAETAGTAIQDAARRRVRWWTIVGGYVGLLATVLALGGWIAWREFAASEPDSIQVSGSTLRVLDVHGRLVFSHSFDLPLMVPQAVPSATGRYSLVEDVNGDGSREVVLFVPRRHRGWVDQLVCFDARGKVLFTRSPNRAVRFGDTSYAPPWAGHYLFLTGHGRSARLWATWVHMETGEFPCLLERLSADGSPVSEYWSAGYVGTVASAVVNGAPSILVGAVNNDHRAASLAVFHEDRVVGSAPAEDPDKACRDCPPGGPDTLLVFPRLELMAKVGDLPNVSDARQGAAGEIRVWVDQQGRVGEDGPRLPGQVYYDVSPELAPVNAGFVANYVASHREAETRMLVDHPFGERDFSQLWPVLVAKGGASFVPVSGRTDYSEGGPRRRHR